MPAVEGDARDASLNPADPGPLTCKVHLRNTLGRRRIGFQGNAGSNVTFTLCAGRGPTRSRALIMSNTGGLRDGAPSATSVAATCPK